MKSNTTIAQRISDFRGFCASNRIRYKEVAEAAGLDYESVKNNMRINMLSDERMTLLEKTAIKLYNRKVQSEPA